MVRSIRLRVLVADDDLAVRTAVCRGLRRHFDVEEVANGSDVIARVEAGETFDAILMDLEMPTMDGRRALKRLTEIAPELAERTLIVTGGASKPELQGWLDGFDPRRVYRKPVGTGVLVLAIESLVGRR